MTVKFGEMSASDKASLVCVALLPIASLAGNAAADLALVLNVVVFLATSGGDIKVYPRSWFLRLSFVFWAWILICSALSAFPSHSFQDSLPWIRFPLYAFALSHVLGAGIGKNRNYFLASAAIGTLIELSFMLYQFIYKRLDGMTLDPMQVRLNGTFGKLIAGWYILCFGLIVSLWAITYLRSSEVKPKMKLAIVGFSVLTTIGVVISGEIMSTITFFGIVVLFLLLRRPKELSKNIPLIVGFASIILVACLVVIFDQGLDNRLAIALRHRIPWTPESDYYLPLKAGYEIAANNLWFGVGPKNTFSYCAMLKEQGTMEAVLNIHATQCPWHPHNLYIQIAAETGLIGLALFSVLACYILVQSLRHFWTNNVNDNIPLAMTLVLFFPIQTYSQAFGQSKNFYFWSMIGFALYLIRSERRIGIQNDRL